MTDLLTPAGGQLHNAKGNVLKKNQLVRDEIFGEGITRGVVQLDRGVGYNVLVDWRQPAKPEDRPKPKSRGPENLTLVGGEQAETEGAREQTILRHTGAEFESGAVHRARGLNESHPGVVPEPAGIEVAEGWRGGHANYAHESGRRRKLASTPDSKTILVPGRGAVKVFKGSSAVEDESWIYITEIKENSSKVYMCLACRPIFFFTGSEARVISHKLRLGDGTVVKCTAEPTAVCRGVLERVKAEKDRKSALGKKVGSTSIVKEQAVAKSGQATAGSFFGGGVAAVGEADAALARWAVAHDVPWNAIDNRDKLWQDFLQSVKKAGPSWTAARRDILSCAEPRGEEARPGGLYLALKEKDKEKDKILTAAAKEGGTLVSDGAKLSTRKRGMLNSALVTSKGVIFLQQTDGTGHTKNGEFLRDDYISAIEKAGPLREVKKVLLSGVILTKKKSDIVKLCVTDRGGGCARALSLLEEAMVLLADTCKGHGADLLIEDWAKPFKVHLKAVHSIILFIVNHGDVYAIFIEMADVLALLIPAETRFATEIICARSLQKDKVQVRQTFTSSRYEVWHDRQPREIRQKSRDMKELVLSDQFWHVNEVFVAVEEIAETSLRILDSDKPNLKDAAFAFMRIEEALKEPLLCRLASIKDWGEINLRLDLDSEHMGKLPTYLMAMLKKHKADWLSEPVLAAACLNPIYMYAALEVNRWAFAKTKQCERAVAAVIKKLLWGDEDSVKLALDGLDRYMNGEGVYSEEGELAALQRRVEDPLSFWRHVSRSGLDCDAVFADEIAVPLVCAFATQSASERLNKYMVDSAGDKKRSGADLGKARKVLDLKVYLMYKKAREKAEAAERRLGERSVAGDLRRVYEQARERAREENKVKERLRELRQEELEEDEHEQSALVTEADASELTGEDMVEAEAELVVPEGYQISAPPSEAALAFSQPVSEESKALVGRRIMRKWEGMGWCGGVITSANTDSRRSIQGSKVNFFVQYEGEQAVLAHVLELADYQTPNGAGYESWLLLEKAAVDPVAAQ